MVRAMRDKGCATTGRKSPRWCIATFGFTLQHWTLAPESCDNTADEPDVREDIASLVAAG